MKSNLKDNVKKKLKRKLNERSAPRFSIVFMINLLLVFSYCAKNDEEIPSYFLSSPESTESSVGDYENYYYGINTSLNNNELKKALHERIKKHRQIPYRNNAASFPTFFTNEFITLKNSGISVPKRFDIWDAYIIFAKKGVNPFKVSNNCPAGKLLDWYDLRCYDTPNNIMVDNAGGNQDAGSADSLASPTARFGSEGVYNREHSWPKSWFNNGSTTSGFCDASADKKLITAEGSNDAYDYRAYVDLHHLIPVRSAINSARSNFSFGIVDTSDTHFPRNHGSETDGAKFGTPKVSAMPGFPGANNITAKVFEPPAMLKGDIARIYFYMATRYYLEDDCWRSNNAVTKANINPWLEKLLRKWHLEDPVSDMEKNRNEWILRIQGNRNPFVDFPDWVAKIENF